MTVTLTVRTEGFDDWARRMEAACERLNALSVPEGLDPALPDLVWVLCDAQLYAGRARVVGDAATIPISATGWALVAFLEALADDLAARVPA